MKSLCQPTPPSGCSNTPCPSPAQRTECRFAGSLLPGICAIRLLASQNFCATAPRPLTTVLVAHDAAHGATRQRISLSIIQSVKNSGWLGAKNTALPRPTRAASRCSSAAGRSICRTLARPRNGGSRLSPGMSRRIGSPRSMKIRFTHAMEESIAMFGRGATNVDSLLKFSSVALDGREISWCG